MFQRISIKATKRFVEDGKRRQKTKEFSQTINPYNRNADGSVKTRQQILQELLAERDEWLAND